MAETISTTQNAITKSTAGDATLKKQRELEKKTQADRERREAELGEIKRAEARASQVGVFDPATGQQLGEVDAPEYVTPEDSARNSSPVTDMTGQAPSMVPAIVDRGAEPEIVENPYRVVRINETIENMTFGAGTLYTFIAGQRYKVPVDLADHLEEHGLVWH